VNAKRIKIDKGREVELYLRRDGERTGLRATMTFKGPATISIVASKGK